MNKIKNTFGVLALFVSLLPMLFSCKDSENFENGGGNPQEEATSKDSEKGEALFRVLNATAGIDSLPDNWYKKNYTVEPTIGEVKDEANPYVRYVIVSDAEEAAEEYSHIVSDIHTSNATNSIWSMDGIGSMAFTVKNEADVYATADVNIQQLPHLTQIRYVPASALGSNSYNGAGGPFYQFGDVVSLKEGEKKESYWICVRPASKMEGLGKSHWISFNLNSKNYKKFPKEDSQDYILPYNLGDKTESEKHIKNLGKLLLILNNPDKYGIPEFNNGIGGIKKSELTQRIVNDIAANWEFNGLWKKVFHTDKKGTIDREIFRSGLSNGKINFFYYKYHNEGSKPGMYMYTLTGPGFEKGESKKINWTRGTAGFDFHSYGLFGQKSNYKYENDTANTTALPDTAFIVRYMTGAQLDDAPFWKKNDPDASGSFTNKNITNVYVYRKNQIVSDGYCVIGDIWTNMPNSHMVCAANSSKIYNQKYDGIYSYFVAKNNNNSYMGVSKKENRELVMFHLLNACMLDFSRKNSSTAEGQFVQQYLSYPAAYKESLISLYDNFTKTGGKDMSIVLQYDESALAEEKATIKCYLFNYDKLKMMEATMTCKFYANNNSKYEYEEKKVSLKHDENEHVVNIYAMKDIESTGSNIVGDYQKTLTGIDRISSRRESAQIFNEHK